MNNALKIQASTIADHLTRCHLSDDISHNNTTAIAAPERSAIVVADIDWVLARWPAQDISTRTLCDETLLLIKDTISQVPTGKQRHYRHALNHILIYLQDVAQWELPARTEKLFIDRNLAWFSHLNEQAELAESLWHAYAVDKANFLNTRPHPSPALAALTIAIDVAPLSLSYLASILSDSHAIEREQTTSTLKVFHLQRASTSTLQEDAHFTRYHLPLFCYRFLADFYQGHHSIEANGVNNRSFTAKSLLNILNEYISAPPYHLAPCSAGQWHAVFQILWHYRDRVPPTLLKDIAQPERHVDFDRATPSEKEKRKAHNAIFTRDWHGDGTLKKETSDHALAAASKPIKARWPQRKLIKYWVKMGNIHDVAGPVLNGHNILGHYLFIYCQELILFGGVNKAKLSEATITKYTSIEACFKDLPLNYETAIDHDQLQAWARQVFAQLENDTHLNLVHYFFRFMVTQALTDHLDLDEFENPCLAPSVDPFCIPLSALHDIVDTLLTHSSGSLFQRFYCAVSAVLGYFAMLRRGDVLRLRIKDIYYAHPNCFHLTITKTIEGRPKNGKTRPVHIVLPDSLVKLVRIAIKLKEQSHYNAPLIGFDDETIGSRQLHYLLPVTKAIKAICGKSVRFHHLRHSGIDLFMQQGLQLVYRYSPCALDERTDLNIMISEEVVKLRFSHWIEKGEEQQINDSLLFDEICHQIGHQHYATTRWSYLHGIQWLFPYLRPQQSLYGLQDFSHSELRYLLNLAPDSNDLSRQLALLSQPYKDKSLRDKQQNPVTLPEIALREFIWGNKKTRAAILGQAASGLTTEDVKAGKVPYATLNAVNDVSVHSKQIQNYYYYRWRDTSNVSTNHFIEGLFDNMNQKNALSWPVLSQIWAKANKHDHAPLNKKQCTALSHLGEISVVSTQTKDDNGNECNVLALQIQVASNATNARDFKAVFRCKEWQWLACSFTLTVNRKTKVDRLLNLVKKDYAQGKESVSVVKQPDGASQLTITLTPTFPVDAFVIEQAQHYLSTPFLE